MTQTLSLKAIETEYAAIARERRKVKLITCILLTILVALPLGVLAVQRIAETPQCDARIECQM